jgi:hypothetical protein
MVDFCQSERMCRLSMIRKTKKGIALQFVKKRRAVLDPYRVQLVTDQQVLKIVAETSPKLTASEKLIRQLRMGINDALLRIIPRLKGNMSDIDDKCACQVKFTQ